MSVISDGYIGWRWIRCVVVACAVAAVFVPATDVPAAEPKRPNILFAFADDWGRYASIFATVEGAGSINDALKTPNIDRIAREGVLFRRAYVNAPSCTPCWSSLLSGQYFWRTGRAAILQGADDPDELHNVAADLKYEAVRAELNSQLMSEMVPTEAPRVTGDKQFFEKPPMAGPLAEPRGKKAKN